MSTAIIVMLCVNSLSLLVNIASLVMLCILRNKNPVTSRRLSAFVALLVHALCIICYYIRAAFPSCFLVVNAVFPISLFLYGLYLMQMVRYLIMLREQRAKQDYASNKRMIKFLLVLSSKWMSLVLLCALVLIYFVIIYAFYFGKVKACDSTFIIISLVTYYSMSLVLAAVGMLALAVHLCFTRKCMCTYAQDPYRFQLEFLLVMGYNILIAILMYLFAVYANDYSSVATIVLFNIGNTFIFPGFPLALAILWSRKKSCIEKQNICDVLRDAKQLTQLKQFAMMELSIENILCIESIQQYKQSPTSERATYIIATFCESYAALEVNITKAHVAQVKQELQKIDPANAPPSTLFDGIETAVCENIMDTYNRYVQSKSAK